MKTTGKTRIFTILAHPATHVIAPIIYNHIFDELRLDMSYIAHDIEPHGITDTIQAFRSWENLAGFNVTIPYKESVAELLETKCPVSSRVKAVNTVIRNEDGTFEGYNTDGIGAQKAIGDVRGTHCLVLGAGGAARSIVDALLKAGAGRISFSNRSSSNSQKLLDIFSSDNVSIFDPADIEKINVVIQATPVVDRIPFSLDLKKLRKDTRVLETVMRPSVLSDTASENHLEVIPGHAMLYFQTKQNFRLLTGIDVPDTVLESAFGTVGYKIS
ncbi:MAG TPA: shikimate dehydrogenase [Deltaproteobacteria bacterium]|nr:shikimate dehydrogenase [Deltaproteobacteria bacterium]